jgi:hypothetical protein
VKEAAKKNLYTEKQIMKDRNTFLEKGGLFWESKTHEWFNDKTSTDYANKKSFAPDGTQYDDALKIMCFVVREKETGDYDRVVLDIKTNLPIYSTQSLEELAAFIDREKIAKRFKK